MATIDKTLNPYATAATQLGGVEENKVDTFMGLSGAADVNAAAIQKQKEDKKIQDALALGVDLETFGI